MSFAPVKKHVNPLGPSCRTFEVDFVAIPGLDDTV